MLDLHNAIMNIQADHAASTTDYKSKREAYIFGHRDARHAAAELATTHAGAAAERVTPAMVRYAQDAAADAETIDSRLKSLRARLAALTSAPAEPEPKDQQFTTDYPLLNDLLQETWWMARGPNNMDTGMAWYEALTAFLESIAAPAETPPAAGAAQAVEPMFFASAEQAHALQDQPGHNEGGVYLPLRKTAAGKFTMPLYAAIPAPEPPRVGDWRIDHSAGRPVLMFQDCSVIEAEKAEYVLRLIKAAQPIEREDGIDSARAAGDGEGKR